jgi:hypothetical protein
MIMEIDRPRDSGRPATSPSGAEMRRGMRRLRLHGATVYACRHCRTPMRVVSAAYLPERCPGCGNSTWTPEGRCAVTASCATVRPAGHRPHPHCPGCGESVWRRASRPRFVGGA